MPSIAFSEKEALVGTLCSRFEKVVQRFPNRTALKSPDSAFTYSQLDALTNGVARHLRGQDMSAGNAIGLLFGASPLGLLAHLAVTKADYLRVGLNISYPIERLRDIITASKIRYLVTQTEYLELAEKLVNEPASIINIEDPDILKPGQSIPVSVTPTTPTAIGYTSGSTGAPKQFIYDHINTAHSVFRVSDSLGVNAEDRMLFTRNTGLAIPFHALTRGACYYTADLREDGDLLALADWLKKEKITILRAPVSTFRAFCWSLQETDEFPHLRLIVLQGEPVYRSDVDAYKQRFSDSCVLVSSLGVSEFGDFCHFFVDKSTELTTPTVPGGYPLKGVHVKLVNRDVPSETEIGEIGITGSFISDPTAERIGGDAYLTGDLASRGPDDCIYHQGRKDFQVKIRGNRVDTQEVEAAILELDTINHTAVVGHTNPDGDVTLVAYIESPSIDAETIRSHLKNSLPEFMVPSLFLNQETLPRTLTGKIDRKSLPAPALHQPPKSEAVTDAFGEGLDTSHVIKAIWKDVLQIESLELDDPFLEIGGDSLKAMMVLARINQHFGIRVNMRTLFDAESVSLLAEAVDAQRAH